MSLAEAVLVVQRAHRGFKTAAGTVSYRSNEGLQEAIRRGRPDLVVGEHPRTGPEDWEWSDPSSGADDFWVKPADKFRLLRGAPSPPRFPGLVIVDGAHWWTYDASCGAEADFGDPNTRVPWLGYAPPLLDPAELLGVLDLELNGEDEVAGRAAFRLCGRQRMTVRRVRPHTVVASYADSYDLWFDMETGVCLRATSILDDHPIMVFEITRIEVDCEIDPGLFVLDPPDGVEVRKAISK